MKKFKIEISFPGKLENIRKVSLGTHDLLLQLVSSREKFVQDMELCLIEGLSNVVLHAHKNNRGKKIRFQILVEDNQLTIRIFDSGPGFVLDPKSIRLPETHQNNGRGLFIISQLMDDVLYQKNKEINYLQMKKTLELNQRREREKNGSGL